MTSMHSASLIESVTAALRTVA
eukprot:COSAG06_NODE_11856_length_1456_cov_0.974208_1_plen_21_part_10